MLSNKEEVEIRNIINESLNKAEEHWGKGGSLLTEARDATINMITKAESEPSKIPGHPIVQDGETVIDEFIALVMDMRKSSEHLMCEISQKTAKVSGLQRVYYETSALLPAATQAIKFQSGNVTEYLGDGVLALFSVKSGDEEKTIRKAYRSANNIIESIRGIVNEILSERYSLPPIDVGVGLAISNTLVTLIGLPNEKHPKAFGQCVFRATKLSNGINEIYIDEVLRKMWPKSDGGQIKFRHKQFSNVSGYLLGN